MSEQRGKRKRKFVHAETFIVPDFHEAELRKLYELGNINPESLVGQRMWAKLTFGYTMRVTVERVKGSKRSLRDCKSTACGAG